MPGRSPPADLPKARPPGDQGRMPSARRQGVKRRVAGGRQRSRLPQAYLAQHAPLGLSRAASAGIGPAASGIAPPAPLGCRNGPNFPWAPSSWLCQRRIQPSSIFVGRLAPPWPHRLGRRWRGGQHRWCHQQGWDIGAGQPHDNPMTTPASPISASHRAIRFPDRSCPRGRCIAQDEGVPLAYGLQR